MHGEGAFRRRECAGRCKRAGRACLGAFRVHEVPGGHIQMWRCRWLLEGAFMLVMRKSGSVQFSNKYCER